MKKLMLPVLLFAIVSTSCQKRSSLSPATESTPNSKIAYAEMGSTPNDTLTDLQIDSIGYYHNLFLTDAFNGFTFNTGDDSSEFRSVLMGIYETTLNVPSDSLNNIMNSVVNFDINIAYDKQVLSNSNGLDIFNSCVNYINGISENTSFSEIENFLGQERANVNSGLQGNNRQRLLSFLSVLEKSCYLWMPDSVGGSGIGSSFIQQLLNSESSQSTSFYTPSYVRPTERDVNWRQVAIADGAAALKAYDESEWLIPLGGAEEVAAYCAAAAAWASAGDLSYQVATAKHG